MPITIPIAHDFICPWCWVATKQIEKLRQEFDIEIEWVGYELVPEWMESASVAAKEEPADKPKLLSRFQFLLAADGLQLPLVPKPPNMRSFNTHQAVEYAKTEGVQDALVARLYKAYWEDARDINNVDRIVQLAEGIVSDLDALRSAIVEKKFRNKVVEFDEGAYATGIYNVPTYFVGEQRLAEQPYSVVRKAIAELVGQEMQTPLYADIEYVNVHEDRPFTFINMVTTIDGKIITGERNEPVGDLGSKTDHFLMHRLERKADAILSGANSLRATGNYWNPETTKRVVVTRSGNLRWDSQFLTQGEPIVVTTESAEIEDHPGVTIIRAGVDSVDWKVALKELKNLGVEVLNVLGGSEINAQLLERELIDELFLTLAPKIKLGEDIPTYAGGRPLPRFLVQTYKLVSHQAIGDEIFLRYRK